MPNFSHHHFHAKVISFLVTTSSGSQKYDSWIVKIEKFKNILTSWHCVFRKRLYVFKCIEKVKFSLHSIGPFLLLFIVWRTFFSTPVMLSPGLIDLNQWLKSWFKSSDKNHDLNQTSEIKKHVILELCVMPMTHFISILIGFHIACKAGVPNLSLNLYPFSILIDEDVPLKFPVTKILSKMLKFYWIFNRTFSILKL